MKYFAQNEPLLYVDQPTLQPPKSNMQSEFKSERTSSQAETINKDESLDISFQHLSIEDQITYLNNVPHDLFQMKCKFTTKHKTYFGKMVEKDKETIEIVHSGSQKVKVNIDELEEIQLIGL